jgi:hydroxymethylpyrimidine/phosphomethylpyrimidine kinase
MTMSSGMARLPNVLVFSGSDPSGGAGMQADMGAIAALGAHALTVPTALTVQDNVSVFAVHPVDAELVRHQAQVLIDRFQIDAVKLGIAGNRANAEVIAAIIAALRQRQPLLPVVFDPVLASGKGDALSAENAVAALEPLYARASIITPNLNEADRLCGAQYSAPQQAALLQQRGCPHVLLKGGHGPQQQDVINRWFGPDGAFESWQWPRLPGEFHGSGCTLAAALAARLAHGDAMRDAIAAAQVYCQRTLEHAYSIAPGQLIPNRVIPFLKASV